MNDRSENTRRNLPGKRPGLRLASAVLLLVVLLAACGQRGPLYLPDEAPPAAVQQEDAEAAKQKGEEDADGTGAEAGAERLEL